MIKLSIYFSFSDHSSLQSISSKSFLILNQRLFSKLKMFNPIKHIAFASSFIALVSATFTVPRCEPGNQDPATGLPCTNYGYEANWLIDVQDSGVAEWFTVNGAFPPPITVNTGERIRITLSSNLANNEAVTLHFHGILQQNGYVVMDGPQGLTQRFAQLITCRYTCLDHC
jgi:hypothetical protein